MAGRWIKNCGRSGQGIWPELGQADRRRDGDVRGDGDGDGDAHAHAHVYVRAHDRV
jgi:hypothetical protein